MPKIEEMLLSSNNRGKFVFVVLACWSFSNWSAKYSFGSSKRKSLGQFKTNFVPRAMTKVGPGVELKYRKVVDLRQGQTGNHGSFLYTGSIRIDSR